MRLGVNVPNFGPGTNPDVLRRWALTVEGLGFDLLMVSDHIAVTPDVAEQYPAPFYEPFTTLSWLAGLTRGIRLGTTVLIVPYRHPLLIARMAANLNDLSGGRLVLGVGVGWAREEFGALGVPFRDRGRLTDEHLLAIRAAWQDETDYRSGHIPLWVGGNSDAALRRAVRLGDAWHPLRFTPGWMAEAAGRLTACAADQRPAAARADAADRAAADRGAGHRRRAAGRPRDHRPDHRGPRPAALARRGHRGARPVQRRPPGDGPPGDGVADAGDRSRARKITRHRYRTELR